MSLTTEYVPVPELNIPLTDMACAFVIDMVIDAPEAVVSWNGADIVVLGTPLAVAVLQEPS